MFVFKNETLHDVNNPCEMAMQINLSYWQTRQLPMQIKAKIETELCFLSFYNLHNVMQKQTQIAICKNEEKQSENMEGKKNQQQQQPATILWEKSGENDLVIVVCNTFITTSKRNFKCSRFYFRPSAHSMQTRPKPKEANRQRWRKICQTICCCWKVIATQAKKRQ